MALKLLERLIIAGNKRFLAIFFIPKEQCHLEKKRIFSPYIVADLKCMDRGKREVEIAKRRGVSAAVVLG